MKPFTRVKTLNNIADKTMVPFCLFVSLFCFCVSVQYLIHLYGYLKEWRKNPHWSFSCCLDLILPVFSLSGDIDNLVGTNNQLQTGETEMPIIDVARADDGALDSNLEKADGRPSGDQDDSLDEAQRKTGEGKMSFEVAAMQDGNNIRSADTPTRNKGKAMSFNFTAAQSTRTVYADREESDKGHENPARIRGNNRFHTESKNKEKKIRTNAATMKDSGTPDAVIEEEGQGDDYPMKVRHVKRQVTEYNTEKRSQGTQTGLSRIAAINIML